MKALVLLVAETFASLRSLCKRATSRSKLFVLELLGLGGLRPSNLSLRVMLEEREYCTKNGCGASGAFLKQAIA